MGPTQGSKVSKSVTQKTTNQLKLNDYVHTPKWFPGGHTDKQTEDKYLLNIQGQALTP